MAGLQTIHMHNSIYSGIRVRIHSNEHTNLLGGNAAGKTSVLHLVPTFYGHEPNRLLSRAANRKSFVDYYLPDKQSMIVFEYIRDTGETCCVVLFRRESDAGFAYRFMEGSADESIFNPALNESYELGADANTIMMEGLPSIGVRTSSMVYSTSDYRAIIQNNTAGSNRSKSKINLRALSSQFSLVTRSKMQHIDLLTTVSLSKSHRIRQLKDMIVDSMLRNMADVGSPPAHDKNDNLWNDLRSLSAFMHNEKPIKLALDDFAQIRANRSDLVAAKKRVTKLKNLGEEKGRELRKAEDALAEKREEVSKSFLAASQRMSVEAGQLKGLTDQLTQQIKTLHSNRAQFEDGMNILHWVSRNEAESGLKAQLDVARGHLQLYEAGSSEIASVAASQKNDISTTRDSRVKSVSAKKDLNAQQSLALQDVFVTDIAKLQASIADERQEKTERSRHLEQVRIKELADVREEADAAGVRTPEETARIYKASESLSQLKSESSLAQRIERDAEAQYSDARRERRLAQNRYEEGISQHDKAKKLRDELTALLYPTDGSLLAFLRESGSDWEQTLGKVINPDLLSRKDLKPKLTDSADEKVSFFGFEFDTNQLSLPPQAESEAILTERLQRATLAVAEADETVSALEAKWKASQAVLLAKDNERQAAKVNATKMATLAEQAERELTKIQTSIEANMYSRKAVFSQQIKQLEAQHKSACDQTAQELVSIEQKLKRQHAAIVADLDQKRADLELQRQQLTKEIDGIYLWAIAEHEKVDLAVRQQLSSQGFDAETITQTKAQISQLKTELDDIDSHRNNVHSYLAWKKDEWPKLSGITEQLEQTRKQLTDTDQKLSALHLEYQTQQAALKEQIKEIVNQSKQLEHKAAYWASTEQLAQHTISSIPYADDGTYTTDNSIKEQSVSLDIESVITQNLSKLTTDTDELIAKVVNALTKAVNAISQNPDSHINEKWNYLRNARLQVSTHADGSIAYKLESMLDLTRIIEFDVPEIRKVLTELVKSAGSQMTRYHSELSDISSKVKHISRILETKLNTEHEFDEFSSIEVRLVSKVEDFDYWDHLKAFSTEWSNWHITHSEDLPPESIQQSLERLDGMFKRAKMDKNDIGSLVDLEISITEQGRLVHVRNDNDLKNVSSEGLSTIVNMVIFAALTRFLCPDEKVSIIWPMDELGTIHPSNIGKIFRMMDKKNITMFSAQPTAPIEFIRRYRNTYELSKSNGVRDLSMSFDESASNPLRKLLEAQQPQEATTNE